MERLARDLRYAIRRLAKKPTFAAIAVISLAIGIGANTAIFSLVNAIIVRDLPVQKPEELVDVYKATAGFSHATFSFPDLKDLQRETQDVFIGVAASRLSFIQTDVEGGVEIHPAELVTGNFFPLLGVPAHIGRSILPEDDVSPGAHPVVMLGYGFWQASYGGEPSVLGQEIRLNGRPYTIIGVAPKAYSGNLRGLSPDVYASTMMVSHLNPGGGSNDLETRGNQNLFGKARLRPGITLEQAQVVTDRLVENFQLNYPGSWQAGNVITLVATDEVIMNPMIDRVIVPAAALMMAVVGLVLLIACANLASFLLAQAADRRREIAIRLALGAKRGTLIRQFLTETVLLALLGGAAGVLLATFLLRAVLAADLPLPFPITLDLGLDGTVLTFTFILTVATGFLFGMAPALQATNPDVAPTLKDESTGSGPGRKVTLRGALVVVQVAVSLVLLVGAGLFLRSLQARMAIDPGFGYEPAAIITVQTHPDRYNTEEARVFYRTLLQEIAALPEVVATGMTADLHLSALNNQMMAVNVDGVDPPPGQDFYRIEWAQVDPGFFDATGVRIVRGRSFETGDGPEGTPVVVVSEALARRFWPGEDPVGRMLRRDTLSYAVVGVARDAKVRSLGETPRMFVYRPYDQEFASAMTIVAQTRTDAPRVLLDVVAAARGLDPELLIYETKTMERHLAVMLLPHRLSALVVTAFGALALLLASIGLFGVVSYAVSSRWREVGIRMALGADRGTVVRLLMGSGMKLVGLGTIIGLVLAVLSGRLLGGLLYGIGSNDPLTLVVVPLVLLAVALIAAWIPAKRASGADPVKALRAE